MLLFSVSVLTFCNNTVYGMLHTLGHILLSTSFMAYGLDQNGSTGRFEL